MNGRPVVSSFAALIDRLDWTGIAAQLDSEGHAVLTGLIEPAMADDLPRQTERWAASRRESLASSGLGRGELFYFDESLPAPWASLRLALYRKLAPIANRWNEYVEVADRYPDELADFQQRNRQAGQVRPQSHLNHLRADDYIALHQRTEGVHVFPLQVVALLSEPGKDFRGGEFVMTEQRPRMQSRPMVLPLGLGDVAIIGTAQRPFKGTRGYYRVNLRHAISRVRDGERIGVELSFHDAP